MANLAFQYFHAGSIGALEVKICSEAISLPQSRCLGMLAIVAASNEGIAHPQCGGHMTRQSREEINACGGSGPDHNRPECFFCKMPFGDITHQANDTYNLALRLGVRGKSPGLSNIANSCRT